MADAGTPILSLTPTAVLLPTDVLPIARPSGTTAAGADLGLTGAGLIAQLGAQAVNNLTTTAASNATPPSVDAVNAGLALKANTADVAAQGASIATNTQNITANTAAIATNAQQIASNTADILTKAPLALTTSRLEFLYADPSNPYVEVLCKERWNQTYFVSAMQGGAGNIDQTKLQPTTLTLTNGTVISTTLGGYTDVNTAINALTAAQVSGGFLLRYHLPSNNGLAVYAQCPYGLAVPSTVYGRSLWVRSYPAISSASSSSAPTISNATFSAS